MNIVLDPLVSIIVPNYNHAPFLEERIASILGQTFLDFEIILMDDCSTDESVSILRKYENHEKVSHVVINSTNSGSPFKQWENGINLAKGQYIWIAESDDWCELTLLETLIKPLLENPTCSVAYVQSHKLNVRNEILWQSRHSKLGEYVDGKEFIKRYMLSSNAIFNASMAIFKKDSLTKDLGNITPFKFCGDWLFWVERAEMGSVYISGKVLNYFRKHDKDVSGNAYATGINFKEELFVLKYTVEKLKINSDPYKQALLKKYILYLKVKKSFSQEVQKELNALFLNGQNEDHIFYLKYNSFIYILKNEFKKSIKQIIK